MLGHCVKQHLEVVVVEQGLVAAVGVAVGVAVVVVVVDLEPLHRQLMLCAHQSHKHSMLADPDSCPDAGQLCCSSTLDTRMHTWSHLFPTHTTLPTSRLHNLAGSGVPRRSPPPQRIDVTHYGGSRADPFAM